MSACPKPRPPANWPNWRGNSTACWKKTALSCAPCAKPSTTSRTTCARPLTRLRAAAETALADDASHADAREALADCTEEAERVLTLLNAVLDVTEAESGMMTLRRERVDVRALLGQVLDGYSLVAEERRIAVQTRWPSYEPCEASVDPDPDAAGIRQPDRQRAQVHARRRPGGNRLPARPAERRWSEVTVRDSGMGIPPGEQTRIWERLYRGDKSRAQRGLGLGLSLVKAIVEAHGGRVEVASREGEGALFTVTLPEASLRQPPAA